MRCKVRGGGVPVSVSCGNHGQTLVVGTSDAEGQYRVRGVGDFRSISARAPGLSPRVRFKLDECRSGGQYTRDLILGLDGAALSGVVKDESGMPLSGAQLQVLVKPRLTQFGWRSLDHHPVCAITSGEDGTFSVPDCGAGELALLARTGTHAPFERSLDLKVGEHRRVVVTMKEGVTLHGQITLADGSPGVGAQIVLGGAVPARGFNQMIARTGEDGRYELAGAPLGSVVLRAHLRDFGERSGALFVAEPGRVRWDAQLVAGPAVLGRVEDEQGVGAEGVWVFTKRDGGAWDARTKTDADGHFRLSDVDQRTGVVHTNGRSKRAGASLAEARITPPFTVLMLPRAKQAGSGLRLRVTQGGVAPSPPARVTLDHGNGASVSAETDAAGFAEFAELGAGPALLRIMPEGLPVHFREVVLQPNSKLDLGDVSVGLGGSLAVTVEELPGRPPGQAVLYGPRGDVYDFFDLEDRVGTSHGLAPGTYRVDVNGAGRSGEPVFAEVRAGETTECWVPREPARYANLKLVLEEGTAYPRDLRLEVTAEGYTEIVHHPLMLATSPLPIITPGLPKGRTLVRAFTPDGLSGEIEILIDDVDPDARPVKVPLALKR